MKKPVDLKISESDEYPVMVAGSRSRAKRYPYGLEINLNGAVLDKLGVKELPEVEEEVQLMCVAVVMNVSKSANGGQKQRNVSMQITKMTMDCDHEEEMEAAMKAGYRKGGKRLT